MICIDLGSGYSPRKGFKTCDVNSYCDYNSIDEIEDNYVDLFYIRNVLHHVKNIDSLVGKIKKKLKPNGIVKIIDCNENNYSKNVFLDKLWYRFIFDRKDIYISENYRNIEKHFIKYDFIIIKNKIKKEKLLLTFKIN